MTEQNKELNLKAANEMLAKMDPFKRVAWARERFGDRFCITSSFGIQAAIMAHIISKVDNRIPILFIDTGYHFAETIAYKELLEKRLNLNIVTVKPEKLRLEFEEEFGRAYANKPDLCCLYNKVLPLKAALKGYDCWGTGIRRGQTEERRNISYLTIDNPEQMSYKLAPIADYNDQDTKLHFELYGLPEHPLVKKGYTSVGCYPCTHPTHGKGDPREGRWKDSGKRECGIHIMHGDGEGI